MRTELNQRRGQDICGLALLRWVWGTDITDKPRVHTNNLMSGLSVWTKEEDDGEEEEDDEDTTYADKEQENDPPFSVAIETDSRNRIKKARKENQ